MLLVGTIRRDGTPRISPVEPWLMDGELWLSMMWRSAKASDLLRDPRVLVHNAVSSRNGEDGEFKLRGAVRAEAGLAVQRRYAEQVAQALGWNPEPGKFHLFAVGFEQVSYIRYGDASGDQFVAQWPPVREFVRRDVADERRRALSRAPICCCQTEPERHPDRREPRRGRQGAQAYRPVLLAVYSQPFAKAPCGKSLPWSSWASTAPSEASKRYVAFGTPELS